jgi:hypothetical protein
LISVGCCDYGVGQKAIDEWEKDYSVCGSHLWVENRQDNGTVHVTDANEIWYEVPDSGVKVSTFAYPLEGIGDRKTLKEKIVEPLLDLLGQAKG